MCWILKNVWDFCKNRRGMPGRKKSLNKDIKVRDVIALGESNTWAAVVPVQGQVDGKKMYSQGVSMQR